MNLQDILQNVGLNEREAKVYLALLELGETSVLQVGLRSGIERTYCYDLLESLLKKGLVSVLEKNGRRRYLAADPNALEQIAEKRLASIRSALPEFRAHYSTGGLKPTVKFYEGKAAIAALYQELINARQYDAITSPRALYGVLGKQINDFSSRVVRNGTRVRELVTAEIGVPEFSKSFQKPLQEVRLLPKEIILSTDTLIYENKVVSIAYIPTLHAVVTEGSELVNTQKALFEYMWQSTPERR
jgi:sugar-specific transcriptional regulator TrmB